MRALLYDHIADTINSMGLVVLFYHTELKFCQAELVSIKFLKVFYVTSILGESLDIISIMKVSISWFSELLLLFLELF